MLSCPAFPARHGDRATFHHGGSQNEWRKVCGECFVILLFCMVTDDIKDHHRKAWYQVIEEKNVFAPFLPGYAPELVFITVDNFIALRSTGMSALYLLSPPRAIYLPSLKLADPQIHHLTHRKPQLYIVPGCFVPATFWFDHIDRWIILSISSKPIRQAMIVSVSGLPAVWWDHFGNVFEHAEIYKKHEDLKWSWPGRSSHAQFSKVLRKWLEIF